MRLTDEEIYDAVNLMADIGGGFAHSIARAYFSADRFNQDRLVNAFPELFEKYHTMVTQYGKSK
jgi:hypothetical protein